FVDDIDAMPQAIADNALDGDVVMCMGAGTIGGVPARLLELLQKTERTTQEGRGL
ncbi:MAG: UDP-N-acetylmuramate--L-alanine ligase, partial [Burkholderiales bacterium]